MKISKGDVKGVLKVLLIVLLVGCAIGCTCYLFFKYLNRQKDSYVEVSGYLYNVERSELSTDLNKINTMSNGRLAEIVEVYDDAIVVTKNLAPYLLTYDVDDDMIIDKLNVVIDAEIACKGSVLDYLTKAPNDETFGYEHVEDVYSDLSNYLVQLSNLILTVNNQIESHAQYSQVDVKFSVIDCYARVLNNTFANLKYGQTLNEENCKNLNTINMAIKNKDGYLLKNTNLTVKDGVEIAINDFIKNYNQCNKDEFALNINTAVVDVGVGASALQNAYHYFNLVFVEVA